MQLKTKDARVVFEALWAKVAEEPANPERHEKFISYVAGNNLAKWGIERYQEAERKGLIEATLASRCRKAVAERAAAIVFFRAPREGSRTVPLAGAAPWLILSGILTLLIGVVSGTAVWPGILMIVAGTVIYVIRMKK